MALLLALSGCDARPAIDLETTPTITAAAPSPPSSPPPPVSSIDGYTYRVVEPGHVTLGDPHRGPFWSIRRTEDRMTDQKLCHVLSQEHTLAVVVDARQVQAGCAFEHDFPGRRAAIRIDGGKPIDIGTERCGGAGIVARLAKGKKAIVRSYKWPDDVSRDADVDLAGLNAAIALAHRLCRNEIS